MASIKAPDERQKEIIRAHKLTPSRWLVAYESKDTLEVISVRSRQRRVLNK